MPRSSQEVARLAREAAMSSAPLTPHLLPGKQITPMKARGSAPAAKKRTSTSLQQPPNNDRERPEAEITRVRTVTARGADSKTAIPLKVGQEKMMKSSGENDDVVGRPGYRRSFKPFGEASEAPESKIEHKKLSTQRESNDHSNSNESNSKKSAKSVKSVKSGRNEDSQKSEKALSEKAEDNERGGSRRSVKERKSESEQKSE
ncbi:unnamed protein product [Bursaphelenchus xylophilus]|nr:unnamed protein product [Bursaphelenchus xylophilus]CAG9128189.1 unnamed protein product [Bursaphelenchus xylophilus]